jgi:hypothetical protein
MRWLVPPRRVHVKESMELKPPPPYRTVRVTGDNLFYAQTHPRWSELNP